MYRRINARADAFSYSEDHGHNTALPGANLLADLVTCRSILISLRPCCTQLKLHAKLFFHFQDPQGRAPTQHSHPEWTLLYTFKMNPLSLIPSMAPTTRCSLACTSSTSTLLVHLSCLFIYQHSQARTSVCLSGLTHACWSSSSTSRILWHLISVVCGSSPYFCHSVCRTRLWSHHSRAGADPGASCQGHIADEAGAGRCVCLSLALI